ncbi:MAG: tripartite tricarboxylate transporter TctB family protein [Rhodobacteraceae bacterium]|nr:tripartite tricarboxylate transporter TctB family protein [Paracoccaceae bacterium]PHR53301.1 MAG: hypothetical protein COA47_17045 [Robiginitomaculum sp.]
MTLDRIIGGIAVAFGGFLLLYGIPANVRMVQNAMPYPAMFPQVAAWMFVGLGLIQLLVGKATFTFPSGKQFAAFLGVIFLVLIMVLLLERLGYVPVAIGLMVAITLLSKERRPLWVLVMVLGLPVGVWLLFEQILQRPLP